MFKADFSFAAYCKMTCFFIIVVIVAPCSYLGGAVTHPGINIGIKKPKRNIHSLDFVNVVLAFKHLWKKSFSGKVAHKPLFCSIFIKLKRDYQIRLKRAGKIAHHNDPVSAKRACGCRRIGVAHNFAAAGFAYVCAKSVRLTVFPLTACGGLPLHAVGFFFSKSLVIPFQSFNIKFGVTERALHFLNGAVEGKSSAAARAFILLQCLHVYSSLYYPLYFRQGGKIRILLFRRVFLLPNMDFCFPAVGWIRFRICLRFR